MPRNPDEVIRTENEIETLLIGYCRRHDGCRWHRTGDTFCITSQSSSRLQFTMSSYMDDRAFTLNTLNRFFNSSQNPVITGLEATVATLDEQSNVDHIQWVNNQLPCGNNNTFRIPNVGGYSNGKSFNPAWVTLVRDVINSISNNIGRTLYYSFVNPYIVRIQYTEQIPTMLLHMDIELFSNKELATRHIYNQLGLRGYNQRGTWIPPAISPIPTQREIELGHRMGGLGNFIDKTNIPIPEYMFHNSATVPIYSTTTHSTYIEQEEALDTDYKDDLF